MQLVGVLVQIRVCRTVLGELPSDEFIKIAKPKPRLKVVAQWDNLVSNRISRSRVSLESNANYDAKVGPSAFHRL
jgi:hypothetical protein